MVQRNEVLTREANRISLVSAGRTTAQQAYLTIAERGIAVNTTEQTWIFEAGEKARVGRTALRLVNTLLKVVKWLNHVGSGKIDESGLESRHNIHHNFRIDGIGR